MSVKDLREDSTTLEYLQAFAEGFKKGMTEEEAKAMVEELGSAELSILLNLGTVLLESADFVGAIVRQYHSKDLEEYVTQKFGNVEDLFAVSTGGFSKF